jgi:hypothetical protein
LADSPDVACGGAFGCGDPPGGTLAGRSAEMADG